MDGKLAKIYSPVGYWKGISAIQKLAEASKVPEETVKKWLVKQALWQTFLPAPKRIPWPRFDVSTPNKVHQADLLFLPHDKLPSTAHGADSHLLARNSLLPEPGCFFQASPALPWTCGPTPWGLFHRCGLALFQGCRQRSPKSARARFQSLTCTSAPSFDYCLHTPRNRKISRGGSFSFPLSADQHHQVSQLRLPTLCLIPSLLLILMCVLWVVQVQVA